MNEIKWRLALRSSPDQVFRFLNTDEGRASFWAEKAIERERFIFFEFINGQCFNSRIIESIDNKLYKIEYFNSIVKFELKKNENNGTDLILHNYNVPEEEYIDMKSGWVSVLLTLKARCDFDVDLRNHDKSKSWDQLYVGN